MMAASRFSLGSRSGGSPLDVRLLRDGVTESVHRAHAVVVDVRGRVLMRAGDAGLTTFIRSALKPIQATLLISSGAADHYGLRERELAIACASHAGTVAHARVAFRILWQARIDPRQLQCPVPEGRTNSLEHNCSGKHAAFLAVCRQMGWPLETYMAADQPLQQEVVRRVAQLLGMPSQELPVARDDCGVPTLQLQLCQMALLYALLSASDQPDLERLSRSMLAQPALVAGQGRFDTELMRLGLGMVVSKSGAEGIQCLGRVGQGLGMAIKVEDGSGRAKYAVALHLLEQLGWITSDTIAELGLRFRELGPHLKLRVEGELRFDGQNV
ncbi:MAG: asparaginase [Aphanocapsa feldmannii 288cV]|nr:MAG: asparaginase [Aphanocapsa feldmannii 288cV]